MRSPSARLFLLPLAALLSLAICSTPALAQTDKSMTVGTKLAPPFVVKDKDGELAGISIELWQMLSERMNLESSFTETDLQTMVNGVTSPCRKSPAMKTALASPSISGGLKRRPLTTSTPAKQPPMNSSESG